MVLGLGATRSLSPSKDDLKAPPANSPLALLLEDGLADQTNGLSSITGRQPSPGHIMTSVGEVEAREARPPYLHVSLRVCLADLCARNR